MAQVPSASTAVDSRVLQNWRRDLHVYCELCCLGVLATTLDCMAPQECFISVVMQTAPLLQQCCRLDVETNQNLLE